MECRCLPEPLGGVVFRHHVPHGCATRAPDVTPGGRRVLQRLFGTVRGTDAHKLDAPEDEKVALLHQSISQELDELCRHRTILTHSYAEAVAVFKHQEAEQRGLELRNLIRTMTTPDRNTHTLEAVSEKSTNATVVTRTSFSEKSRKSRPGGKKCVKTT
ncbi:hypothetical protein E4U57_005747, partial [Claviceps arundinis]